MTPIKCCGWQSELCWSVTGSLSGVSRYAFMSPQEQCHTTLSVLAGGSCSVISKQAWPKIWPTYQPHIKIGRIYLTGFNGYNFWVCSWLSCKLIILNCLGWRSGRSRDQRPVSFRYMTPSLKNQVLELLPHKCEKFKTGPLISTYTCKSQFQLKLDANNFNFLPLSPFFGLRISFWQLK